MIVIVISFVYTYIFISVIWVHTSSTNTIASIVADEISTAAATFTALGASDGGKDTAELLSIETVK